MDSILFSFFNPFPWYLDLAAFILGTTGFLMAIQPFAQMIWGRPDIRFNFSHNAVQGREFLICHLINSPRRKRIWRILGVRRDSANEVYVHVSISEAGSKRIIVPQFMPQISISGTLQQRVALPPSEIGARVTVVFSDPNNRVIVPKQDNRQEIQPGVYIATIGATSGERIFVINRQFTVDTSGSIYWNKE